MKNIFDTLTKGGLGAVGDTLKNALGAPGLNNMGEKLAGTAQAAGVNAGAAGDKLKGALGGSIPGGIGGLLGAGALGGLLGTLLSGKSARKVAAGALVAGGAAAAGALAWKFYQKWSQNAQISEAPQAAPTQTSPGGWPTALASAPAEAALPSGPSAEQAALPQASETGMVLLEAMVFAARADGHIDEQERTDIHAAVQAMFPGQDAAALVDGLMDKPLDPASLAARVPDYEEGCDLYRLSCAIIDVDHFMERSYLDALATALRLTPEDKFRLEQEASQARQENR